MMMKDVSVFGSLQSQIQWKSQPKKMVPKEQGASRIRRSMMKGLTIVFLLWTLLVCLCAEVILENQAMLPFHNHPGRKGHGNATMPALHFDAYPLPQIRQKPASVQVAASVSGCEAKFWVDFDLTNNDNQHAGDHHISLDPSSEGARVSQDAQTRHRFVFKPTTKWLVLNEWVAFKFALLLGIKRVPTVIPWAIDTATIEAAINDYERDLQSKYSLFSCRLNLKHKAWWIHTSGSSSNSTNHGDAIVGTLQIFISSHTVIQRGGLDRWMTRYVTNSLHWPLSSPLAQRERDTRALWDTLLGNWDRYNNDFVIIQDMQHNQKQINPLGNIHSPQDERLLLYLDNNGLSPKTKVFRPRYCRFYASVVERLRLIHQFLSHNKAAGPADRAKIWLRLLLGEPSVFASDLMSNNGTTDDFFSVESPTRAYDEQVYSWIADLGVEGSQKASCLRAWQFQILKAITSRLNQALHLVDGCVVTYGVDYVYRDEGL